MGIEGACFIVIHARKCSQEENTCRDTCLFMMENILVTYARKRSQERNTCKDTCLFMMAKNILVTYAKKYS